MTRVFVYFGGSAARKQGQNATPVADQRMHCDSLAKPRRVPAQLQGATAVSKNSKGFTKYGAIPNLPALIVA